MEALLQMNPKVGKRVPRGHNFVEKKRGFFEVNCVSCRGSELTMQERKTNLYKILCLDSEKKVSFDEIRKAYRSLALLFHPDVCPDPSKKEESTRRFIEVQKAYETLSNPTSRQVHDYELGLVDHVGGTPDMESSEEKMCFNVVYNPIKAKIVGRKRSNGVEEKMESKGLLQRELEKWKQSREMFDDHDGDHHHHGSDTSSLRHRSLDPNH
ncbi:DnaJ domain [Dillenia turbinata]|uniref:DnaJ domain n=1 Tax=Dillenia turbinata TaxID=194707 RepID=A0AAN8VBB7_9MAGN